MATATKVHRESSAAPVQEAGANGSASPEESTLRVRLLAAPPVEPPTPASLAGIPIWIRGLSGTERSSWDADQFRRSNGGVDPEGGSVNIRGRLLVRTIVDEAGARVFTIADADVLGKREAGELEPLFDIALRRSGLSEADLKEVEDGLKVQPAASASA